MIENNLKKEKLIIHSVIHRYRTLMCPENDFWKGYNEWIEYSNSDEYFKEQLKKDKEVDKNDELPF